MTGLLASGALLGPDLGRWLTWVKLGCVLLIALNGVSVTGLAVSLAEVAPASALRELAPRLRRRVISSAALSQTCWWCAILIGMITTGRRG